MKTLTDITDIAKELSLVSIIDSGRAFSFIGPRPSSCLLVQTKQGSTLITAFDDGAFRESYPMIALAFMLQNKLEVMAIYGGNKVFRLGPHFYFLGTSHYFGSIDTRVVRGYFQAIQNGSPFYTNTLMLQSKESLEPQIWNLAEILMVVEKAYKEE